MVVPLTHIEIVDTDPEVRLSKGKKQKIIDFVEEKRKKCLLKK